MQDGEDSARNSAHEATFTNRMRMLSGYPIGRALRFAVDLDLATILVDGPCTIEDLAAFTETDPGLLERNIRRLESVGVFRVRGSTVEVTELGASLARDAGAESTSIGADLPELEALEPVQAVEIEVEVEVIESVAIEGGVSADSGARANDSASASTGNGPVISSVLNDWTGDDFNRILGALATATPPGGRLMLIELVLPANGVVERVGETDPLMVATLGGRGHTAAEWASVLAEAGFRLERIRPGAPPFSFLDAVRE